MPVPVHPSASPPTATNATNGELRIPDPSDLEERPYLELKVVYVKEEEDEPPCAAHCGAFSDIFKAVLKGVDGESQMVAVKVLRAHGTVDSTQVELIRRRANRETHVWHNLFHPNVLKFLGVTRSIGPLRACPAFVSPYCENGPVKDYLKANPSVDSLEIIRGVASGLMYLHDKDIIHGDLKPPNILIGSTGLPLICDFGRSEILLHRGFTTTFAGSRRYMAPEMFIGTKQPRPTQPADVFAFAISSFEIWTRNTAYPEIANEDALTLYVGEKNNRPAYPVPAPLRTEHLWPLFEECWDAHPDKRMQMKTFVEKISLL